MKIINIKTVMSEKNGLTGIKRETGKSGLEQTGNQFLYIQRRRIKRRLFIVLFISIFIYPIVDIVS